VTAERRPDPDRWGVLTEYVDAARVRRTVSPRAIARVLAAMGADGERPHVADRPWFARGGERLPPGVAVIELENGTERRGASRLPVNVPHGYHALRMRDGSRRMLVVSPRQCFVPAGFRTWGWAVQLYAVRSRRSWGMGDLRDLAALCRWARTRGAGAVLINPLHAALPRPPQEASPYFASSRLFRNPLYLAIEDIDGARTDRQVMAMAREARELNGTTVIDRNRIYALKMRALERLWQRFTGDARFERFCAREGRTLDLYACFCVLSERHPGPWSAWPDAFRSPDSPAVARLAAEHFTRVNFHRWLQWLLDEQLQRAAGALTMVQDVAVGFAPDGADAWLWQDVIARGACIGAPPDVFNAAGQAWGLPPFDPHRLRAAGYAPLIATLRAAMRHGGGVRIDHVMGMFRLWWVPTPSDASQGAYVRYPAREMLDIVALESARARCVVIGEDLGTVGAGVRPQLERRRILSYRIAWFEPAAPRRYPVEALAALSTHDLPTVAGLWSGEDEREMAAYGVTSAPGAAQMLRRRVAGLTGLPDGAPASDVVEAAYAALAAAPSRLLVASLDDATLALRRPNLPGAGARDNWSIPLPRTLEQLRRDALPRRVGAALASDRRHRR
jgi:4-alpha-glucanotransferase